MHELKLHGQVTFARYEQVLSILAGVAAMQPQRIYERCIIYKPLREPEEPGSNLGRRGGTQSVAQKQAKQAAPVTLYYTKLVQRLSEDDFGIEGSLPQEGGKTLSADVQDGEEPAWSFVFNDIPDTGDRGVSIRFTHTTDLLSGDPHAFMIASGPNKFECLSVSCQRPLTDLQVYQRILHRRIPFHTWQRRHISLAHSSRARTAQRSNGPQGHSPGLDRSQAPRPEWRIRARCYCPDRGLQ